MLLGRVTLAGFKIESQVGEGRRTLVYRAKRLEDDKSVILKLPKLADHYMKRHRTMNIFQKEAKIARALSSVHGLLQLEDLISGDFCDVLVLEDFGGMSLQDYLTKCKADHKLELDEFFQVALQVVDTLAELHKNHIIHMDIKTANLLINPETKEVKVGDLGLSIVYHHGDLSSGLSPSGSSFSPFPPNRRPGQDSPAENKYASLKEEKGWPAHQWLLHGIDLIHSNNSNNSSKSSSSSSSSRTYLSNDTRSFAGCGTALYMSPEQTGRTELAIDFRTDLYSFGIVCYELLTGTTPFADCAASITDIVHAHLGRIPPSLHDVDSNIPKVVSAIIDKLLAKQPADRYQSAIGLQYDLAQCARLYREGNVQALRQFRIAQRDISDIFTFPCKLYGRGNETKQIIQAVKRAIYDRSRKEVIFVTGESGTGKTALVKHVIETSLKGQVKYIAGKFDKKGGAYPLSAIIEALRPLIHTMLSERDLERTKGLLLSQLGINGQVIVDILPEIELVLGRPPDIPTLPPAETQARFNSVFVDFIEAFCNEKEPLLMFMDDVQWADASSLAILEQLVTISELNMIFVIGCRSTSASHPVLLQKLIDKFKKKEKTEKMGLAVVELGPLPLPALAEMIADMTKREKTECLSLAKLVHVKTGSNIFFVREFLKRLYMKKLLVFDYDRQIWKWHSSTIKEASLESNVAILLSASISNLSLETQHLLQLAACIGTHFTSQMLALLTNKKQFDIEELLWEPLKEGMIVYNNQYPDECGFLYSFGHDQILHAAYKMIPEQQAKRMHLQIGFMILKCYRQLLHTEHKPEKEPMLNGGRSSSQQFEDLGDLLFDVVNHINKGKELLEAQEEIDLAFALNVEAGKRALSSNAHQMSLKYYTTAISLLPGDAWQTNYRKVFDIHMDLIKCIFLERNVSAAEEVLAKVLQNVEMYCPEAERPEWRNIKLQDKAKVYNWYISIYLTQQRYEEGLEWGLKCMQMLGMEIPRKPSSQLRKKAFIELTESVRRRGCEHNLLSLLDKLKPIADFDINKDKICTLSKMVLLSFLMVSPLYQYLALKAMALAVDHGYTESTATALLYAPWVIGHCYGKFDLAYEYATLGLQMVEKFNLRIVRGQVLNEYGAFQHWWRNHPATCLHILRQAHKASVEVGDLLYACHSGYHYMSTLFFIGTPLDVMLRKSNAYIQYVKKVGLKDILMMMTNYQRFVQALQGKGEADEFDYAQEIENCTSIMARCHYFIIKTISNFMQRRFRQALGSAKRATKLLRSMSGFKEVGDFYYYHCLSAYCCWCAEGSKRKKDKYHALLKASRAKLGKWVRCSRICFEHKWVLVEAAKAQLNGEGDVAMRKFKEAIKLAAERGYMQDEAIARELKGKCHIERKKQLMAEASYRFLKWGAAMKVRQLDIELCNLGADSANVSEQSAVLPASPKSSPSVSADLPLSTSGNVDVETLMKVSHELSEEMDMTLLLEKSMKALMENAGAEKSYLLLEEENGEYRAISKGSSDQTKGNLIVIAESCADYTRVLEPKQLWECKELMATSLVSYCWRTNDIIVLDNASRINPFSSDTYISSTRPLSILCIPIVHRGRGLGVFYAENNLLESVFTSARVEILSYLSSQIAISLQNARMLRNMHKYTLELAEKNEALRELNSLKDRFLATTSHELRTPLNGVIGMASLLAETELNKVQTEYVQGIQQSGESLLHRVNDILDICKMRANKFTLDMQEFDVLEIIERVLDMVSYDAATKNLELSYSVQTKGLPRLVYGDGERLTQVLINVLSNAIKFTNQGSVLLLLSHKFLPHECNPFCMPTPLDKDRDFIPVKRPPEKGRSILRVSPPRAHTAASHGQVEFLFEVRDTGIGIPKEKTSKLFTMFSQLDSSDSREQGGSGIGLYLCKEILHLMGGEIWVQSDGHSGSTFFFSVSLRARPPPTPAAAEADANVQEGHAGNQVLVDGQWTAVADILKAVQRYMVYIWNPMAMEVIVSNLRTVCDKDKVKVVSSGEQLLQLLQEEEENERSANMQSGSKQEHEEEEEEEVPFSSGRLVIIVDFKLLSEALQEATSWLHHPRLTVIALAYPLHWHRVPHGEHIVPLYKPLKNTKILQMLAELLVTSKQRDSHRLQQVARLEQIVLPQPTTDSDGTYPSLQAAATATATAAAITAAATIAAATATATVATAATVAPVLPLPPSGIAPDPSAPKVLVVEDNPLNMKVLCRMLDSARIGYDAVVNGKEAVAAVAARPYKSVLMDVQMPVMDGLQATQEIRQLLRSEVPIIAVTASVAPEECQRCIEAGMNDLIVKPIRKDALLNVLQKWTTQQTLHQDT